MEAVRIQQNPKLWSGIRSVTTQLERNSSIGMSFEEKGVFFPLKIVLTDYFSFTKSFFFYKDFFLFRKRKRSQKPSAFLSFHLHSLQCQNKKNQYLNFDTPPWNFTNKFFKSAFMCFIDVDMYSKVPLRSQLHLWNILPCPPESLE